MQHECRIRVLETKVFPELQEKYLADPKSGSCPCFKAGDTFLLKRTPQQDDFYHLMNGKFCGEAWDAVSRYVYTALQGGSIMHGWTNDERMMITCCNDGTRPVIFKIERIDIPGMRLKRSGLRSRILRTLRMKLIRDKIEVNAMTEWERLQQGLIYNDFDEDLFYRRIEAKKLFRMYNKTVDEDVELRNELMQKLFKKVGNNVWIEPDFKCEFGKNITIEDDVYINFGCVILDCAEVTIGSHTLLGPNIGLYPVNHATDAEERINGGCYGKPIHIGKNVWLGGDVKVLAGVSIGDNSIIGTASVVTKNIPANVITVGNPCKIIREITDMDKTDYLERLGIK